MTKCHYHVVQHDVSYMEYTLIDCGANGGICGSDMKVQEGSECFVDVVGLAGHKVSQLHIVTAPEMVTTHKGDVFYLSPNGISGKRKEYFVLFENGGTWSRYQ
jgi:threonine dehydrogenase-like Zn-dependent dehydrogenase